MPSTLRTRRSEAQPPDTSPAPRWPLVAWAVVAALLLTARLAAPYAPTLQGSVVVGGVFQRLVELWLVAGFTLWALPPRVIDRLVHHLPPARQVVVALVGAMVLLGQHGYRAMDLYPFVEWGMYSSVTDRIFYSEYLALVDGEVQGHLPLDELVPTSMRGFMDRLDGHVADAADGDEAARSLVEETFGSLVEQLDDPRIDAVLVRRCHVQEPTIDQPVRCQPVLTVPVPRPAPR